MESSRWTDGMPLIVIVLTMVVIICIGMLADSGGIHVGQPRKVRAYRGKGRSFMRGSTEYRVCKLCGRRGSSNAGHCHDE